MVGRIRQGSDPVRIAPLHEIGLDPWDGGVVDCTTHAVSPETNPSLPSAMNRSPSFARHRRPGFTILELMVAIVIVAILAVLGFTVFNRSIMKGRQVQTASLGRAVGMGITNFMAENMRPPNPPDRDDFDTVYGEPGGAFPTSFLVGVLTGGRGSLTGEGGATVESSVLNPRGIEYVELPLAPNRILGVSPDDGRIYDAWGRELMFAINSRNAVVPENQGERDEILYTRGLMDYLDTRPGFRAWAFISMGADGLKGRTASSNLRDSTVTHHGSDDVISW